MEKMKYLLLGLNMLQTYLFVENDIVFYYFFFQMVLFYLYRTNKIIEANIYSAFCFTIVVYCFAAFFAFGWIKVFPTSFFAAFVVVFTNFVVSVTLLETDQSTYVCGECPICFETGKLIQLPKCKHNFHAHCLKQWYRKQKSCPLCRDCLTQSIKF